MTRQADAREADLLDQVGVLEEHGLGARDDLGEQAPGQDAGAQVDAVGEIRGDAGQLLCITWEKITV